MKNQKSPWFPLLIIIAAVGFVGVVSYGIFRELNQASTVNKNANSQACTEEAKICPDGTAVGRTGPNCEFAPCPSVNTNSGANANASANTNTAGPAAADWKRFTDEQYGFMFQYPYAWSAKTGTTILVTVTPPGQSAASAELGPDLIVQFKSAIPEPDPAGTVVDCVQNRTTVSAAGQDAVRQNENCFATFVTTYIRLGTGYLSFAWPEGYADDYPEYERMLQSLTLTND